MAFERIGVFAGAFDPFHSGHLNFIDESIKKYELDKVLILIEEKSKFKQSFADFTHRRKIVELSIKNMPAVELYEPVSASFPLSSTLPKIKKEYESELYLLIGDDVREHISSWPDSGKLLAGVKLVVAVRAGEDGHSRVSSGKVREHIQSGVARVDMQADALRYCIRNGLYG